MKDNMDKELEYKVLSYLAYCFEDISYKYDELTELEKTILSKEEFYEIINLINKSMEAKIIFLKGLPASGKSTWAKEFCKKNPGYERLNKDDIRIELGNPGWSKKFENEVLDLQRKRGLEFIGNGYSLIIDDTNFAPKHEEYWRGIATKHGYEFTVKYFETSVNTCIERDKNRENPVGEAVIRDMYKRYVKPNFIKTDTRIIKEHNSDLPSCIICDIDGTLALINGRNPYDNSKVHTDKLNWPISDILEQYVWDVDIILVSGRKDSCRKETREWLDKHDIPYTKLLMRKADDNRPDDIVKREIYEECIENEYNVLFVLDDRDKVVKMWRDLGLTCLQVYYGDF